MPELFGGWRRDADAAVVDRDRLAPVGSMGREVGRRDRRARGGEGTRLALAQVALVEGVEPFGGESSPGWRRGPAARTRSPGRHGRPCGRKTSKKPADGPEGVDDERGRAPRPRR